MLRHLLVLDLEYNSSNKLVSLATAIIFALAPFVFDEMLSWRFSEPQLIILAGMSALVGYLTAETYPIFAKALPVLITATMIVLFSYGQIVHTLYQWRHQDRIDTFLRDTNHCEGFALINKHHYPQCMKKEAIDSRALCFHVKGNEWSCDFYDPRDIVHSTQPF